MSFRDIKHRARRDLHRHMQVPALYVEPTTGAAIPCNVRVHYKPVELGEPRSRASGYAQSEEIRPRIVCMLDQLDPKRGGKFSVEPGEAYIVDHTEEQDGLTVTAVCAQISKADAAALPLPANYSIERSAIDAPDRPGSDDAQYFEAKFTDEMEMSAGDADIMPLSTFEYVLDTRQSPLDAHEFFSGGKFRPHAIGFKYYFVLTLKGLTDAANCGITAKARAVLGAQLGSFSAVFSRTETDARTATLFIALTSDTTSYNNGIEMVLTTTQDITIEQANLLVGLGA